MTDGRLLAEKLLVYARVHLHLSETDEIYVRNVLLSTLGENAPWEGEVDSAAIAAMTSRRSSAPMRWKRGSAPKRTPRSTSRTCSVA